PSEATAATELSTLSLHDALPIWLEFDTVNRASQGNVAQRQRTTSTDGSIHTRQHFVACSQTFGCNNVTTLAIGILQQRDVGRAVRIVFQALYNGFNAIFITLEIDQTVMLLVATTFMTGRDTARVVATTCV